MTGLDLDAIRERWERAKLAWLDPNASTDRKVATATSSARDVPALLAEVDLLRAAPLVREQPEFMWLAASQDGGVAAICDHEACRPLTFEQALECWGEVAFYGGPGPIIANGKPYFALDQMNAFIGFMHEHAATHGRQP